MIESVLRLLESLVASGSSDERVEVSDESEISVIVKSVSIGSIRSSLIRRSFRRIDQST